MCGIIGNVGSSESVDFIFNGLRNLEYRGYDSAGIAVLHDNEIHLEKAAGKLINLGKSIDKLPREATLGIGHTRWATHGKPTASNAHPHQAEKVVLVHNGIIENYQELKASLIQDGHHFSSETDTEIVAQLINKELITEVDPKTAILNVLKKLEGAYALGILLKEDPDAIWIAKQGSPLVVGLGSGRNVFASDATVIGDAIEWAVYLNDGEMGRISKDSFQLWDLEGREVSIDKQPVEASNYTSGKAGYPHYMLKEIHEQPQVMKATMSEHLNLDSLTVNLESLGFQHIDLDKVNSINIIACGTAMLAGRLGKYFLEPLLKKSINVELASEFRYRDPYLDEGSLTIAISQSGETADTLACVKQAKSKGGQVLSICNVRNSSIARESNHAIYMLAGPEIGVASTKAFTSQALSIYLWGLGAAFKLKSLSQEKISAKLVDIHRLPSLLEKAIASRPQIKEIAKHYYDSRDFLYLGRGPSYTVALEGALKLKEISYSHAEGYAAGELKHGPIALVDKQMPVVVIAPKDHYHEKTVSNIEEVRSRDGQIISILDADDDKLQEISDHYIVCPSIDNPCYQAILSTIPIQLLAYEISVQRGNDVDQPRNLAKSVTVE